jgi:hypothetical protein
MNRIIVDSVTKAKLASVREKSELCDDSGYILGHFIPLDPREPRITPEEIDRRQRAGGGRSLAEILADLEKKG